MVRRTIVLGLVAGPAGSAWGGSRGGLGALLGALAAGTYAWSYLGSHLFRAARERFYEPALIRQGLLRLGAVAVLGGGLWLAGRPAILSYLVAFGAGFGVLVALEAPRVARQLRATGGEG